MEYCCECPHCGRFNKKAPDKNWCFWCGEDIPSENYFDRRKYNKMKQLEYEEKRKNEFEKYRQKG